MTIACFAGLVIDPDKLLLIISSFSFAIAALLALRKFILPTKLKVGLIYGHLVFLFFPFVLLTTDVTCGVACMPCANNVPSLVALALPVTVAISTLAGLFVIPAFYTLSSRRELHNRPVINFVKEYSRKMGIQMPKLYLVDKAKPLAFSFRSLKSAIFISIGMFEVLNRKEIEAVILHELAHIKQRSSMLNFSASLMKIFSPLSLVAKFHDSGKEEAEADSFASRMQKTGTYLRSAKKKIEAFGD